MAVTRLAFSLDQTLPDGINQIDLARALSSVQRTLIHQKNVFTVVGGMICDNIPQAQPFEIATAPNTWYCKAAINRLFSAWKKSRSKTLELTENVKASKYSDFKILLNNRPANQIRIPITHAKDVNGVRVNVNNNEWVYADLINEAGQNKFLQIVGDHGATRYSAVKGWIQTRPMPRTSDPVHANIDGIPGPDYEVDFIEQLHETNDAIGPKTEQIIEDNDEAPFEVLKMYSDNIDNQDSLQMQCYTFVGGATPTQMIPGFKALCGLVQVKVPAEASSPILFLDVLNTPEAF